MMMKLFLYTRYPIVARALGLAAAFRPSARASKGILHTKIVLAVVHRRNIFNLLKAPDFDVPSIKEQSNELGFYMTDEHAMHST